MNKEKYSWEIFTMGRNFLTIEQICDLSVSILAISEGKASRLHTLSKKMDLKDVLLQEVNQLPLNEETVKGLGESLEVALDKISYVELMEFLEPHVKALEVVSHIELADQIILQVNQSAKETVVIPHQVTEIVSSYLNMPAGSSLHSATMGLGMAATELMEMNKDIKFFGQGSNKRSLMLAELRFYMRNADVELAYGDVISTPKFVEGNQMQRFDFVYMSPPFGMKINDEQENAIESDQFDRFDHFGKPSKANFDFGYVISGLTALKEDGKAAFLLPTGALFRSGADQKIREGFLKYDVVEAVIELPAGLLAPYTNISTVLVLFNRNKPVDCKEQIMLINVENLSVSGPARTVRLTEQAMNVIERGLSSKEETAQISRLMTTEYLKDKPLLPSRYIFEAQMDFEEYGVVKFDLSAFGEISTTKQLDKLTYRGYNALPRNADENGPYAVLKIADVEDGKIDYDSLTYYRVEERTQVDKYRIKKGDVILSIRGQGLKIAVFEQDRDDVLLSQNFVGIRCGSNLNPYFLKMYLESPTIQFILNTKLTGSTVMNLPIHEVEALAIPVLPIEKQNEIVESFQKQFEEITDEIKVLEEQLKNLKLKSYTLMGLGLTFEVIE